ncbi:MAG: DUF1549 and DUF1553 domain-containing protein [Planctomycetales bacterium]|nr:DUF1549 and DUF1553 domain-containing protein [Planctomycetales bacterium]
MRFPSLLLIIACGFALVLSSSSPAYSADKPVSFELDVQPILVAQGCSAGACHGKSRGQNGFQLSLLCFDPDFDHAALTQNARGRRVFPASPDKSLLLLKGAAILPHGGGQRIAPGSADYETLRRWIEQGASRRLDKEPKLVSVTLDPKDAVLKPKEQRQIKVTAQYSDGTSRDVTAQTAFQSSEAAIVSVNKAGLMAAGPLPGEATLMARYMYIIATCNVAIPMPGQVPAEVYAKLPRKNFIDEHVWTKLQSMSITPSETCDDATFLRRAHVDLIGRLPTPDEVRKFLADGGGDKRERLVDALLQRPEFADHWANKWADLLRPNPYHVGIKATFNYDQWIRDSFRQNKPMDQFARELITAQGSTWKNGASVLFRDRRQPEEITTLVSQLFLGIRLDCAKCHHHPFEKWGQDDFYSFAAFFARVGHKGQGISAPISGGEEIITLAKQGQVLHPLTKAVMPPRPLFGEPLKIDPEADPREALADWITSPSNDYFPQVMVNRVWADLMGRGIVEPVDDLRATNPPSNPALMAALAKQFRDDKFDLKKLLRHIATSHVYSLSSKPTKENAADTRNYSRRYRTRMRAEVLADGVCDITGIEEKYEAMPQGSRATQLWTHRIDALFLDTFGRPDPNQDPPCERISEGAVTQILHLMNGPDIYRKVTADEGRAAQLAASPKTPEQITEEIYLLCYGRLPSGEEQAIGKQVFAAASTPASRRQATEDLLWALLNTPEFVFND